MAQLFSSAAEDRADGVFGDAQAERDLVIRSAFEMKQPDDGGFGFGQAVEHALDEFPIFDTRERVAFADVSSFERITVRLDVPQFFGHAAADHFVDDNPPADDCQVRAERRITAEAAQDVAIVSQQSQEDVGRQVIDIVVGQGDAASVGGVLDHVGEEAGKAIHKLFPRPRFSFQATVQQDTVDFQESHDQSSS